MIRTIDIDATLERLAEPTWNIPITPEHYAEGVRVAVERARQEMFEGCVKACCSYCYANIPVRERNTHGFHYFTHEDASEHHCSATLIRIVYPERSVTMNKELA